MQKVFFILFGTDKLIENFKDLHENLTDENSIQITSLKNLKKQVEFILEDDSFGENKNIFLEIEGYDVEDFKFIVDELKHIQDLILKFVVLNGKDGDHEEDVIKLVDHIDEFNGSRQVEEDFQNTNMYGLDDISQLTINMDNSSYLFSIVFDCFDVDSIQELPEDIKETMKNTILKMLERNKDNI